MFRGEISKTCYYCHKQVGSTLLFECSHYICNLCLYRQLFCYHLKDFQTLDQITVKCKCQDGSLTLSLDDIEEILKEKTFTDNCNSIEKFKDDIKCIKHPSSYVNYYCVECSQLVCKQCAKINENEHFCHRIISGNKLSKTLKTSIASLPLIMQTKEEFLKSFENVCKKVKEVAENNYSQIMEQLNDLSKTMSNFKKQYEIEFKKELTNIVKKLNLYHLFYLHFYYDLEVSETCSNLNLSRYLNNINEEFIDAEISLDNTFETKLSHIKKEFEMLKKNSQKKISANFVFTPVKRDFTLEEKLNNFNNKQLTTVIQTRDELLVTGITDNGFLFWEEDRVQGFNNILSVKEKLGTVIHLKELIDGKIATIFAREVPIYIWTKTNKNYQIHQTLNEHKKIVTSITQLKDGKMLSCSKDANIIIWKNNDDDKFIMIQKIYENEFPILNLLCLFDNRFIASSQDMKVRIYTENGIENTFACTQVLVGIEKPINCWCQLKNGQLLMSCESKAIFRWKDIYQNNQYNLVQKAEQHKAEVLSIIQCKDSRIASSSADNTIVIWQIGENDKIIPVEKIKDSEHGIYNLFQLSDGRLCGIVNKKKEIWIWRNRNDAY